MKRIELRGAWTHNLKGIDLDLHPPAFVVIAGPSGAGKSSLVFSTIYAEAQRRFVEGFSSYARQFLERLPRPPLTSLEPVAAGIAIEGGASPSTSRSTVATITEIADYAKLLWVRASHIRCLRCGGRIERHSPESAAALLLEKWEGKRALISHPVELSDEEAFLDLRERLKKEGYERLWLDGVLRDLEGVRPSEALRSSLTKGFGVVVDRLLIEKGRKGRLIGALEEAMRKGKGRAMVGLEGGAIERFSKVLECLPCGITYAEPKVALLSFNSPLGACPDCKGFGRTIGIDWEKVFPDPSLSIKEGAIACWRGAGKSWEREELARWAERAGIRCDVPIASLSEAEIEWLKEGDGRPNGWWGIRRWFKWLEERTYKAHVRIFLSRFRSYETCRSCQGSRLRREALQYRVGELSIADFFRLPAGEALAFIEESAKELEERGKMDPGIRLLLDELEKRLQTMREVGLSYLELDRPARTLSGGEMQRLSLTTALSASISNAIFVFDEPTLGLHPSDIRGLAQSIRRIVSADNLALVVENEPDFIFAADRVIELGPEAGKKGGRIVFDGTPAELLCASTASAKALASASSAPRLRRKGDAYLELDGASGHHLKHLSLRIPLRAWTCVIGPSGSGKSTLVADTLVPAVERALGASEKRVPLPYLALRGVQSISQILFVDQSPLGRTSRGNPASYLGAWEIFRKRLAGEPKARALGFTARHFSFNTEGGRCEHCQGEGIERVDMQFLADLVFPCSECGGKRFVGPVLEVRYRGLNVAEILELTIEEGLERFADDQKIVSVLRPAAEIGLGYLRLGQPLSTLSGGEAQRLKLAQALGQVKPKSLLVLDEPSSGLHPEDVGLLARVLHRFVDDGGTLLVVEHDMKLACEADWIIELGPGAGKDGGSLVAIGTPEEVAKGTSLSAPFLRRALGLEAAQAPSLVSPSSRLEAEPPFIRIEGAREHNLANIHLSLPRGALIVCSGPSGSGKSTLAFNVLYAEAQRRFFETLSAYVRRYLPELPRPEVDRILGLPPTIALEQRLSRGGSMSTVGTLTEVAQHLRVLWAQAGVAHCPLCAVRIEALGPAQIAADASERFGQALLSVLAPVVRAKKGAHKRELASWKARGFFEARIDGLFVPLSEDLSLSRYAEHDIEIVVGRVRAQAFPELEALVRKAASISSDGSLSIVAEWGKERFYSTKRACPRCGLGIPELDPRFFSFHTRHGRCPRCEGRGRIEEKGQACPECGGSRLSPLARSVLVGGKRLDEILALSVSEARLALPALKLDERARRIAEPILAECERRLAFLEEVGLGYLSLDRSADTLSGGEIQRVRLAAQLGANMTWLLYVLDEPTIGLHPKDTGQLLRALRGLVDQGNTVLVVEHDLEVIRAADHVVDFGPGGGKQGGRVVAQGKPELIASCDSLTGQALRAGPLFHSKRLPVPPSHPRLWLRGARGHNLKDIDVAIPCGRLTVVSGLSGSGKSTLIRRILLPALQKSLGIASSEAPLSYRALEGASHFRRALFVDQSPIGRTPRSVPATYIGIWDEIRQWLAATPEARAKGYGPSRFSFNSPEGGRCPRCEGNGQILLEMAFLPDILVPCEACQGMRFDEETLSIRFHGRSAGEILKSEVEEARLLFASLPSIARPLAVLSELGLGHLELGQPSNTLSGGEAQRVKLAAELGRHGRGPTLYAFDEPTTGLHRSDVERLLALLRSLVERGDTVIVIEHHLDVIAAADWVIDLGPEGGANGGSIVYMGELDGIIRCEMSHTGRCLREWLGSAKEIQGGNGHHPGTPLPWPQPRESPYLFK
ncbi:MAG: excinuclease ABC subunit UvrA [Sandaracinaceae bacterium]|nr:excinuclease ABC subunit UvrA [Sandaracinaceae bacterium]